MPAYVRWNVELSVVQSQTLISNTNDSGGYRSEELACLNMVQRPQSERKIKLYYEISTDVDKETS